MKEYHCYNGRPCIRNSKYHKWLTTRTWKHYFTIWEHLLIPNRLRLGRNNDWSPIGPMMVTENPEKFLFINEKLFNTWFECWLISQVPKHIHHPKWPQTDRDVKVGNIVLFLKQTIINLSIWNAFRPMKK